MKIQSIDIQNFLGAVCVKAALNTPITLFAGKNYAGKSSVRDAINLALTADLTRISLKKDAAQLITTGQEYAAVEITTSDGDYGVTINKAGKITDNQAGKNTPAALPYVLNAQRFASLNTKERSEFLFGLMGVKTSADAIKKRLLEKNLNPAKVEQITPYLKSGFDAAHNEAKAKARDSKTGYKTLTGGETWGKEKGGQWQPAEVTQTVDPEHIQKLIENAQRQVTHFGIELADAQQQLGAAKQAEQQNIDLVAKRQRLEEKAGKIERIRRKLAVDTENMITWQDKVAATRLGASGKPEYDSAECPCCKKLLRVINANGPVALEEYLPPLHTPDIDAVRRLPDEERALALLESAIANGKRDLAEAEQAGIQLNELPVESPVDIDAIQAEIKVLNDKKSAWQQDHNKYSAQLQLHNEQVEKIKKVLLLHVNILDWTAIADALAPDGIPTELLKSVLTPINDRLKNSANLAEWMAVTIDNDMSIYAELLPYNLLSESEQWRADAMIAEAIAFISGIKLLVLDRVDVLDQQKGRADLFYWLDELARSGELDTALLFATLKTAPNKLLDTVQCVWIENGVNQESVRVAA